MKMKSYRLTPNRWLLSIFGAFLAIGLHAQDSSEEDVELAPFTVTGEIPTGYVKASTLSATRTNTKILDLPHTVQVVTKEQIKDMGIDTIGHAARYVTNTDTRAANEDSIGLRGFSSAQFFVDGTASEGGGLNGDRLQAFVERVEVVKGASAVLYGAAQAGGLVNVVTVKPLPFAHHEVQIGVGDKGYFNGNFDTSAPLNSDGSMRYRVTGSWTSAHSGSHPYFSPAKRKGLMSQFYLRPREGTELLFQHSFTNYHGHLSPQWRPYWNSSTDKPWNLPHNWYRGEEDDFANTDITWAAGTWIQRFSDNWYLKANMNFTDKLGIQEWGYTRNGPTADTLIRNFRHLARWYKVYNMNWDLVGDFEVGEGADGVRNKLVIGGQLRKQWEDNEYTDRYYPAFVTLEPSYGSELISGAAGLAFLQTEFNGSPRSGTGSAYVASSQRCGVENLCKQGYAEIGQVMNDVRDRTDIKITQAAYWNNVASFWPNSAGEDSIHVTAGGRWDYYRQTTTDWESDFLFGGRDRKITNEDTFEYFPRYAVLTKLSPEISAYVMYSEAMKPVLGYEPTTGQKFLPEIAEQIEAGVKFSLLDNRFTGSFNIFEIVRTNIKETDHVRFITVQSKEATAKGWEFDSHFQISDSLQLLFGWSGLDQEISASVAETYTGDTEEINPSKVGEAVRNIADGTGYIWAKHRILEGPAKGISVAFGGSYIGERYIEVDRSRTLPSYFLIDGMVKYDFQGNMDGFSVQANVSNAMDEQIFTTGTGTFGKPGYLRRIRFHATYSF